MTKNELKELAVRLVLKDCTDPDKVRYCDDLYDSDEEEIELCLDHIEYIKTNGLLNFEMTITDKEK